MLLVYNLVGLTPSPNSMTFRLLLVLLILTLAACASSPQTRFFALDPVSPGAAPAAGRAVHEAVKVDAVHLPPALDRDSIVRGESDNELEISSQDRWAGDLGEMIRRVLTQDLAERLPSGMVVAPESPAPPSARGLVIDILTFQPQAGDVVLDADWTLLAGTQSNPVLRRSEHLTAPAASSAQEQAAAMSTLLGELADSIAARIGGGARGAQR
ncbi:MAG: PqiC family protein [Steroidobacteraceae bacterium]